VLAGAGVTSQSFLAPCLVNAVDKWLRPELTRRSKYCSLTGCQWLTPVILASREVEIRRIKVQSQPGQLVPKTLSQKKKKNQPIIKGLVEWLTW
jgi:hypothetical protein